MELNAEFVGESSNFQMISVDTETFTEHVEDDDIENVIETEHVINMRKNKRCRITAHIVEFNAEFLAKH